MIRLTLFLALTTAWCADAVLMYALAEARWGSVMNRFFAGMLLGLALMALIVAIGPQAYRALSRLSVRLRATLAQLIRANRRPLMPAPRAAPTALNHA